MRLRNLPIKGKLTLVVMLTTGIALLLACIALVSYERHLYRKNLQKELQTIARITGSNSTAAIEFDDPIAAREILSALWAEPQIVAAAIYTPEGKLLADYRRDLNAKAFPKLLVSKKEVLEPDFLVVSTPVHDERSGGMIGNIYLKSDLQGVYSRLKLYGGIVGGIAVMAFLMAITLTLRLQRQISDPILKLAKTTREVSANKNYSTRAKRESNDELGELIDGFNEMLIQIEAQEAALQHANTDLENRVSRRTMQLQQEIAERKKAEKQIHEQAALLSKARDAIIVRDLNDLILFWNKSAEELYGWSAEEANGMQMGKLFYADTKRFVEAKKTVIEKGDWMGQMRQTTRTGKEVITESRWTLLRDNNGKPESILVINTDITERTRMEEQLLRSQRMESIGTLAGGIAHDLNNILTPILMSIELLKLRAKDQKEEDLLSTLDSNARRGADLVKQVLYFARGNDSNDQVVIQPRHVIREVYQIARDTFPKSIKVLSSVESDLWPVCGDPTQMHQLLLNLCVNARDAMPEGGILTLQAENVELDTLSMSFHVEAKPGKYVVMRVNDSGTGIPAEIKNSIFEPFFTTKEIGKGTGLGLSTVMAITKNHNGFLDVYSEPGKGTTFTICLPASSGKPVEPNSRVNELPRGNAEMILLVDDEATVRNIGQQTLEAFGYQVLTAEDGPSATDLFLEHKDEIQLVLTDLMMPGMGGIALIEKLQEIRPDVKVIVGSGMAFEDRVQQAMEAGAVLFLQKPYTTEKLLKTFQEILSEQTLPPRIFSEANLATSMDCV